MNAAQQTIGSRSVPVATRSAYLAQAVVAALLAAPLAHAQQSGELEELIVTAPKYVSSGSLSAMKSDTPLVEIPQSVTVISRDQIDLLNWSSVQQSVRYTAGITGENFGPDERYDWLTLRGFYAGAVHRRSAGADRRESANTGTDLYGFEAVDILKGPSSVLYGLTPPGGIVNMRSRRPADGLWRRDRSPVRQRRSQAGRRRRHRTDHGLDQRPADRALPRPRVAGRPRRYRAHLSSRRRCHVQARQRHAAHAAELLPEGRGARRNERFPAGVRRLAAESARQRAAEPQPRRARLQQVRAFAVGGGLRLQPQVLRQPVAAAEPQVLQSRTRRCWSSTAAGSRTDLRILFQGRRARRLPYGVAVQLPVRRERRCVQRSTRALEGKFDTGPLAHTLLGGHRLPQIRERTVVRLRARAADRPVQPGLWRGHRHAADEPVCRPGAEADRLLPAGPDQVGPADRHAVGTPGPRSRPTTSAPTRTTTSSRTARVVNYVFENGFRAVRAVRDLVPADVWRTISPGEVAKPFEPTTGEQVEGGIKWDGRNLAEGNRLFATLAVYKITQDKVLVPDPDPTRVLPGPDG